MLVARVAVAGAPPGDRARDPAAVERERRDQVEDQHEQVDRRQVGEQRQSAVRERLRLEAHRRPEVVAADEPIPIADAERRRSASVTSGPATATLNSTPGESVSRAILAMPPNSHRSMPAIAILLRHRHQRVAELVQQDRQEEQQRAGDREQERLGCSLSSGSASW